MLQSTLEDCLILMPIVLEFKGELIHFGTEKFPDWDSVIHYLQ